MRQNNSLHEKFLLISSKSMSLRLVNEINKVLYFIVMNNQGSLNGLFDKWSNGTFLGGNKL